MPEELQLLTLVVAVEHENVSPTLVARTPTNAEGITFPGRQCAGSSPAPALQDSPMGRDTTVNFFNTRCRVFEFLVRWFYRRTATVLRMNAGRITSFGDCINLAFTCHSFWANADRITLVIAGSIPARSLLRKSCPFCRPPGECRQDYNLSRYMSCHLLVAAFI